MRVLVAGGGTGGHIYPAVAVLESLAGSGIPTETVFVGTRRGLEGGIVSGLGYRLRSIVARPLPVKKNLEYFFSLACALVGTIQSVFILGWDRPNVVIGTGGYASAPVVLAGRLLGIPILLIEPNSVPGRTTTMLARFADEVALGLQESVRYFSRGTNLRVTGVPIRPSMLSCTREEGLRLFGLDPGRKTVFVFGGSRGASSINRAFVDAARTLQDRQDLQFLVQTGAHNYETVAEAVSDLRIPCVVHPYIDDIGHAYAAGNLAVCRAGAGTIAELTAFGLPSILIPYPHATAGHQETNARILEESGAASVILDEDLNGRNLANAIVAIIDDAKHLEDMSRNSRGLGNPDASREIAVRLVQLAQLKGRLSRLAAVLVELCSVR